LTLITKPVYIGFIDKRKGYPMTTTEAYHATFDEMERRGARLLDAGATPAKLGADLLCVVLRLQCEGRFTDVDVAKLEDVLGEIVAAQEAER
jgi:hypothetical protein